MAALELADETRWRTDDQSLMPGLIQDQVRPDGSYLPKPGC